VIKVRLVLAKMPDRVIPVSFGYKVEEGQVVKKTRVEMQSDYVVTSITDMQEFKRAAQNADEDYTPEEQETRV
jgi:hypothetical protein